MILTNNLDTCHVVLPCYETSNLAFYDERNLLRTVEKSARSVWLWKIREAIFAILGLQLAEAGSVAVL